MNKLLSGLCATTLAVSFAAATTAPVNAAPVFVPRTAPVTTDVQQAQYNSNEMWRMRRGMGRAMRYQSGNWQARRNFQRRGDWNSYNGYRGYRYHRPGYHSYNGWWYPAAAFVAGALITSAIVNQQRVNSGNAHVDWCYSRYRSYRAYDNTYQPYYGPRRQCYSPY
jgi:hypothetical protein